MSKARGKNTLTSGAIYAPMMKFMLPVKAATFLQAMYAAVDLLVIGRFVSTDATVIQNATAAVGTGGMIMTLITYVIQGLTTGITVTLGRFIGAKRQKRRNTNCRFCHMYFCCYGCLPDSDYGNRRTLFCKMDERT